MLTNSSFVREYFLQRVSCNSRDRHVCGCPSVCHTLVLYQNDASYRITTSSLPLRNNPIGLKFLIAVLNCCIEIGS